MKKLSELKLTEQAYLAVYNEKEQANEYHAIAIDDDGNNYLVICITISTIRATKKAAYTAFFVQNIH